MSSIAGFPCKILVESSLSLRLSRACAAMTEAPLCDVSLVHEEAVEAVVKHQAGEDEVTYLADTFQMLASPTRLRIVEALAVCELCVCDLAAVVGASQSAVSHQLRQLRQMRIVRHRKEGRMAYYRLDDPHIEALFSTGLEHVREVGTTAGPFSR